MKVNTRMTSSMGVGDLCGQMAALMMENGSVEKDMQGNVHECTL